MARVDYEEYKQYLESDEWKVKREERLEKDGHRCVCCNSSDNLNVHHITYDRLKNESIYDLITLCRDCHEKLHKIQRDGEEVCARLRHKLRSDCETATLPYILEYKRKTERMVALIMNVMYGGNKGNTGRCQLNRAIRNALGVEKCTTVETKIYCVFPSAEELCKIMNERNGNKRSEKEAKWEADYKSAIEQAVEEAEKLLNDVRR